MIGEHCRALSVGVAIAPRRRSLQRPFVEASQERADAHDRARRCSEFLGLADKRDAKASDLPYGDQRQLEMARALATQPRLLLLDEPAAGMNPHETDELDEIDHAHPRPRHHHRSGRARHAAGDGHFRPRYRAQFRHQDRRGHIRRRSSAIRR